MAHGYNSYDYASSLAKAETVLPLVDLYKIIENKDATDTGVELVTDGVAQIYSSASQPGPHHDESDKKRQRIA